jgi:hypothetical protein
MIKTLKILNIINSVLILTIGIYGLFIDEPYFRANGHNINYFDLINWFFILFNAPSSIISIILTFIFIKPSDIDNIFTLYYFLWTTLSFLQWFYIFKIISNKGFTKFVSKFFPYIPIFFFLIALIFLLYLLPQIWREEHSQEVLFYIPINVLGISIFYTNIYFLAKFRNEP